MGKREKLILKLQSNPKDFTFEEAQALLEACGYKRSNAGKTSGSRVRYIKGTKIFRMHKPHPRKELLSYQVKELVEELKEEGLI